MTRIVFLSALTALVGCKKDECEDTGNTGACDTGAVEDDAADTDVPDDAPVQDSCTVVYDSITICYQTDEDDNSAWCDGEGGTYNAAAGCDASVATGSCDLPAGGAFSAPATAWYIGGDGESACTGAGGSYTAI